MAKVRGLGKVHSQVYSSCRVAPILPSFNTRPAASFTQKLIVFLCTSSPMKYIVSPETSSSVARLSGRSLQETSLYTGGVLGSSVQHGLVRTEFRPGRVSVLRMLAIYAAVTGTSRYPLARARACSEARFSALRFCSNLAAP